MAHRATDVAPGLEQALLSTIPLGRLGLPEEAADAVLSLSSFRSSFTTGTSVILDGGMKLSCEFRDGSPIRACTCKMKHTEWDPTSHLVGHQTHR